MKQRSWSLLCLGRLGGSSRLAEHQLHTNARQWLLTPLVVIRHANLPTVTHLNGHVVDILPSRSL